MAEMSGWSHVAISVADLAASVAWYRQVLAMEVLFSFETAEFRRTLLRHASGVVLALTQHGATARGDAFDPARIGLDHLSFRVRDEAALRDWVAHLDRTGTAHNGIQRDAALGSALVACRDPDGLQLEWYLQTGPPAGGGSP